jgi:DNA modification methylase
MASAYNPRTISDHDFEALRRSLREFGAVQPIVVNVATKRVVGGHQRIRAAQAEGIQRLPVVHVRLDEVRERQLNVALNRISGEWDPEKLEALLRDLGSAGADLSGTGFTEREISELLTSAAPAADVPDDDVPDLRSKPTSRLGDLIELGRHRLLCGDSTDRGAIDRVVGDLKPTCMWTDPPYGVRYESKGKRKLSIANDTAADLSSLLPAAFANADAVLAPGAAVYVAHPAGELSIEFARCFVAQGWRLHQTLVWLKDAIALGHADYHYRHEPILFGYRPGPGRWGRGGRGWFGDNRQASVIEAPRPRSADQHPTVKPLGLVARCLRNSTPHGGVVFDPFLGSGSTLIAAELLGRTCVGLELDPRYADVVVSRWEKFTGQKAKRPKRGRR